MKKRIFSSLMLITSLAVAVTGSAFALFRDYESIPGNTISSGTVDIALSDGTGQFPSPIVANNLMPGEFTDWSRIRVTNHSSTNIKLFFYATDVNGGVCDNTILQVHTGPEGGDEHQYEVHNASIEAIKGVDNMVEITGFVFDPDMEVGETAVVLLRAGLAEGTHDGDMGDTCSWTGVFVGESYVEDEEPPMSFPVSFPEELVTL